MFNEPMPPQIVYFLVSVTQFLNKAAGQQQSDNFHNLHPIWMLIHPFSLIAIAWLQEQFVKIQTEDKDSHSQNQSKSEISLIVSPKFKLQTNSNKKLSNNGYLFLLPCVLYNLASAVHLNMK